MGDAHLGVKRFVVEAADIDGMEYSAPARQVFGALSK